MTGNIITASLERSICLLEVLLESSVREKILPFSYPVLPAMYFLRA